MGKPHFSAHADLDDIFIAAWIKFKETPAPGTVDKMRNTIHDAIANFRRRTGKSWHKVKGLTVP